MASLPADVRSEVEAFAGDVVASGSRVSGGSISDAWRVSLRGGRTLFVKAAAGAPRGMFAEESRALRVLHASATVRVPEPLCVGDGWIALEWLEPARSVTAEHWSLLGRQLARLHRTTAAEWGWEADNFIGTLPQPNGWLQEWPEFWKTRRLQPQLAAAAGLLGVAAVGEVQGLLDRLDALLAPAAVDGPSLLHGDLWSGNVHMMHEGPALVDPASAFGHREVDLAMAALFGGFPPEFTTGYAAEWPLQPGSEQRCAIYQLYYLLVHVNLFGAGYVDRTRAVLRRAAGG